MKIIQETHHAH